MARKKKEMEINTQDLTLEQEFRKAVVKHKICTIRVALNFFGDKLYNNSLLREYKDITDKEGLEKATYVETDLYLEDKRYNTDKYNKVYELCWEYVKDVIPSNRAF